jgi:hypothetical protein
MFGTCRNKIDWKIMLKSTWILSVIVFTAACLRTGEGEVNPELSSGESSNTETLNLRAVLTASESYVLCAPVDVVFTIFNQGDSSVYLLTWYTPLEGVFGNIFQVTYMEQELPYLGPMVMRGDPLPDQYVLLEPGGSETVNINLSDVYDFSRPGDYTIEYKSPFISQVVLEQADLAKSVDDLGPVLILSEPVSIRIHPSAGEEEICNQGAESPPSSSEENDEPGVTLTGTVRDVSPSARIIWFQEEMEGISSIALTSDCKLTDQDNNVLELNSVLPGMAVMVAGQPGTDGVFLAEKIIIYESGFNFTGE